MTDAELIQKSLDGDGKAFEELVRRYYQKAYRTAMMYVKNPDTALDISQEAFLRVYRNLKHYRFQHSFGGWLYQIVKHLCLNHLKRKRRKWLVFSDAFARYDGRPRAAEVHPVPDGLEMEERARLLWQAMQQLPPKDREILMLKEAAELSYQDIARLLDIPMGTVMSRLYYARKKLAGLLKGVLE